MPNPPPTTDRTPVQRISVSLPEALFNDLERLVEGQGFDNRSKAIARMIAQASADFQEDKRDRVMAGTITLIYDENQGHVLQKLAEIERTHVAEVISSLHVQLQSNHRLEVILMQGPAKKLKTISDQLIGTPGVRTGKLTLTSMILPPLHAE